MDGYDENRRRLVLLLHPQPPPRLCREVYHHKWGLLQTLPFLRKELAMPGDTLSQQCGHLFEVGFNCGLLTFLAQQERAKALTTQGACAIYQPDLARLRFHPMATFAMTQAKTIGPS